MKRTIITFCLSLVLLPVLLMSGCAEMLAGSAVGAIVGQAIGHSTEATLIGATIGAGAGYIVGNENDKEQAAAERAAIRQQANKCCPQVITACFANSDGSQRLVKLTRYGSGYVGECGEYYYKWPTYRELRPIYGY